MAIVIAERFADGLTTQKELKQVRRKAFEQWERPKPLAAWHAADFNTWSGASAAAAECSSRLGIQRDEIELSRQCADLRDIFGNPFRPVAVDPSWLTSDVVAMCRGMYETRDFAAMPILADALQDAGCENADVLSHCRGDGPHVRGCWVVDLMLGKA